MRHDMISNRCLSALAIAVFGSLLLNGCGLREEARRQEAAAREQAEADRIQAEKQRADEPKSKNAAAAWPTFFGSPSRNPVNTTEKNIAPEWTATDKQKNIKWVVELGSRSYAGPVMAGGRIFLGTNNENPRDPKIKGDKGVLLCLDQETGKFLWQAIYDKLPAGRVVDWPLQGICSTPHIDGDRLYFVNNRCEVVCADVAGNPETQKAKEIWKLDMIHELGVFPHNLAASSPLVVGDLLFVITSNGVDQGHINIPSPQAPSFLALDKHTGKLIWSSNLPTIHLVEALAKGEESKTSFKQLV